MFQLSCAVILHVHDWQPPLDLSRIWKYLTVAQVLVTTGFIIWALYLNAPFEQEIRYGQDNCTQKDHEHNFYLEQGADGIPAKNSLHSPVDQRNRVISINCKEKVREKI